MKYLSILAIVLVLVTGLTACSNATPTTTTWHSSPAQPIEVVGVTGPMPPISPGGPDMEITLKNNGTEPVVHLTAVLQMQKSYDFSFDVTISAPLTNGQTISSKQTLIGPGSFISYEAWYSLIITATLQSGSVIEYTVEVKIDMPTVVPILTVN
jgi:hypothetical protein